MTKAQRQQRAEAQELRMDVASLLNLVARLRAAVGDPHGKLMQDELVAHCQKLVAENRRLREAVERTLAENAHLADGETCTLIWLKRAL